MELDTEKLVLTWTIGKLEIAKWEQTLLFYFEPSLHVVLVEVHISFSLHLLFHWNFIPNLYITVTSQYYLFYLPLLRFVGLPLFLKNLENLDKDEIIACVPARIKTNLLITVSLLRRQIAKLDNFAFLKWKLQLFDLSSFGILKAAEFSHGVLRSTCPQDNFARLLHRRCSPVRTIFLDDCLH